MRLYWEANRSRLWEGSFKPTHKGMVPMLLEDGPTCICRNTTELTFILRRTTLETSRQAYNKRFSPLAHHIPKLKIEVSNFLGGQNPERTSVHSLAGGDQSVYGRRYSLGRFHFRGVEAEKSHLLPQLVQPAARRQKNVQMRRR